MTSLAAALNAQIMNPDALDFLYEKLGREIVDSIPTMMMPEDIIEGGYPKLWEQASDLRVDAVKGALPSGRAFLAVRYMTSQNKLALELFFQRYPLVTRSTTEDQVLNREEARNWVSSTYTTSQLIGGVSLEDKHFALLKSLFEHKPLEETGGRYLPIFAEHYKKV